MTFEPELDHLDELIDDLVNDDPALGLRVAAAMERRVLLRQIAEDGPESHRS